MSEPRQDNYKNHAVKLYLCGEKKYIYILFEVTKFWSSFFIQQEKANMCPHLSSLHCLEHEHFLTYNLLSQGKIIPPGQNLISNIILVLCLLLHIIL